MKNLIAFADWTANPARPEKRLLKIIRSCEKLAMIHKNNQCAKKNLVAR